MVFLCKWIQKLISHFCEYILNHCTHLSWICKLSCSCVILASGIYFKNRLSFFKYCKTFRIEEETFVREMGQVRERRKKSQRKRILDVVSYHLRCKWTIFIVSSTLILGILVTCLGSRVHCGESKWSNGYHVSSDYDTQRRVCYFFILVTFWKLGIIYASICISFWYPW